MTIINKSTYHLTIVVDGDTPVNTEITSVSGYPPNKYVVTYFEGSGTLEVSQDGTVWVDTYRW
jgi:effector-binding domain-containing protein